MTEQKIRVLLDSFSEATQSLICMRLAADRCEVGGRLYPASAIASALHDPLPVAAVILSSERTVRIGDVLIIQNPRGADIGRSTVSGIELSHTNLLTDTDHGSCVTEALEDPSYTWSLILSSGPIWCFRLADFIRTDLQIDQHTSDTAVLQDQPRQS